MAADSTHAKSDCGSADRTLRILHVLAPARFGGLEQVVAALATGQTAAGHHVRVAAILDGPEPDSPLVDKLLREGVPVDVIHVPPRAYLHERRLFAGLCRNISPDVIHTHGYRADVLHGPVARRLGIPIVTTVHGFTGNHWKNRIYERLQLRAFRRFDAVVAVSQPLEKILRRAAVPADRLYTLPNAWSPGSPLLDRTAARRALGLDNDQFTIGWVGRLTHEKGADVLVRAMEHLTDLPIKVSFLGDGSGRTSLERLARQHQVSERVTWHGAIPDAARLFRGFDAFVLSSRTEGTPISLFEAMAAHVPIIATSVGGVPDVVSAREARLVPPADAVLLGQAVRSVFQNPHSSYERADAARRKLEKQFSPSKWLDGYTRVYRCVCKPSDGIARPHPRVARQSSQAAAAQLAAWPSHHLVRLQSLTDRDQDITTTTRTPRYPEG